MTPNPLTIGPLARGQQGESFTKQVPSSDGFANWRASQVVLAIFRYL